MNILYNIIILEPFMSFCIMCDCMTITVTYDVYVMLYDIMLIFFYYFQINDLLYRI